MNAEHSKPVDIYYARNAYNSTVHDAAGFSSGKRICNRKAAEKELRELLWKHRDHIAALVSASFASREESSS